MKPLHGMLTSSCRFAGEATGTKEVGYWVVKRLLDEVSILLSRSAILGWGGVAVEYIYGCWLQQLSLGPFGHLLLVGLLAPPLTAWAWKNAQGAW
jgi:hypothetical protein